jgi:hypothetical protein
LRIENAQPGNEMGYPKDWDLSDLATMHFIKSTSSEMEVGVLPKI